MHKPSSSPVIYGDISEAIDSTDTRRPIWPALKRGLVGKCPHCAEGSLFKKYTTINTHCPSCNLDISGHRADDAPPYFTMVIAGHIIIPLALEVHRRFFPPIGLQFLIWGIILIAFSLWLLPVTKGALINLQWANRMHGFSDTPEEDLEESLHP